MYQLCCAEMVAVHLKCWSQRRRWNDSDMWNREKTRVNRANWFVRLIWQHKLRQIDWGKAISNTKAKHSNLKFDMSSNWQPIKIMHMWCGMVSLPLTEYNKGSTILSSLEFVKRRQARSMNRVTVAVAKSEQHKCWHKLLGGGNKEETAETADPVRFKEDGFANWVDMVLEGQWCVDKELQDFWQTGWERWLICRKWVM